MSEGRARLEHGLRLLLGAVDCKPSIRRRRPSFAKMLKQARKTGVDLTVTRDGSMTFRSGQPPEANEPNPWDEVL